MLLGKGSVVLCVCVSLSPLRFLWLFVLSLSPLGSDMAFGIHMLSVLYIVAFSV